jgi:hypothetical protein
MAKHKFMVGVNENGVNVGAQCIRCGQIALYENGKVPDDIAAQECKKEDPSQAAARIVREATEG